MFGDIMGEVVGLESFARFLRDTKRGARVVEAEEVPWLENSFFNSNRHLVQLEGSSVDVISIRMQGWVGPFQNLQHNAFSLKVGGIPIMSNQVYPLQYNYVVRGPDQPALKAKLKQSTNGFFSREKKTITWSGGQLADRLYANEALMADLFEFLDVNDGLEVVPEKGYTRIVHKTTMALKYNLLSDDIVQLYRGKLPEPLLAGMETIAGACRLSENSSSS